MACSNIIGYVDPLISYPGDKIAVKVSCSRDTFTSKVFRLGAGYNHENAPPVSHQVVGIIPQQTHQGKPQFSRIGSFARVKSWKGSILDHVECISISLWCQATLPMGAKHEQFLFSSLDTVDSTGFECFLAESGNLIFRVGGPSTVQEVGLATKLIRNQWFHLHISIEPLSGIVRLKAKAKARDIGELSALQEEEHHLSQAVRIASKRPLIIAGDSQGCEPSIRPTTSSSFNGKIEAFKLEIISKECLDTLLDFDFSLDIPTDRIRDKGMKHHGELINAPSRAVTGHDWDASQSDWTQASYGYGAIHFHDDDLDDAFWHTSFELEIPKDLQSGCYGVLVDDGKSTDFIPFFVRPDPNARRFPAVAVIIPTFTYAGESCKPPHSSSSSSLAFKFRQHMQMSISTMNPERSTSQAT